jgi:phenylalanyl-tRNA synthetase alpha chain
MTLADLQSQIQQLQHQLSSEELNDDARTKYLGKKGLVSQLTQQFKNLSTDDRKQAGQLLNDLKKQAEKHFSQLATNNSQLNNWLDVTQPGIPPTLGHLHPVTQAIEEVTRIFTSIGFTRVRYPEIDWDWYVFEALNFTKDHPARDDWETFWIDAPPHPDMGVMILSTHTSNGQVREMERVKQPPIRMINIAKCYRRQQDITHTHMFHQFEGLVVDKGINIQHLKGTIDYFASKFYGPGTKSRIRPYNFPFTEPSFEVDFSCTNCNGTGVLTDGNKCRFCKSGWHEVGGAGMVHPNVLKAGKIDPEVYTGFAFGWGIERTYTLKPGLKLDDIRLLYENNLEFLKQF